MGQETIRREIDRLEQLSRTRELTERESWHLQKMINTQGRIDRAAKKRAEKSNDRHS